MEQGHNDKFVTQIFKAHEYKKKEFQNNMKDKRNDYELVFKITYHPNFSNLKDTMSFQNLLLTSDKEDQKLFHQVPTISFQRTNNLKDILVKTKVSPVQKNEGYCGPCKKLGCETCVHM